MGRRRASNDPEEILKLSPREILDRLAGDANAMYAMGETDKAVLQGLIEGRGPSSPHRSRERGYGRRCATSRP